MSVLPSPTRLVLIRHASPVDEARTIVYGRLDLELSSEGRDQAKQLGKDLAKLNRFAALYTSPQLRAAKTAEHIGDRLGLPAIEVDDLRELDFGSLEGLDREEAVRLHPELASWTTQPRLVFPGGESVAVVRARAVAATRAILARHPGEAVAVVTHAIPIRAIVADALRIHSDAMFRLDQSYGGVTVIDWFGEHPLVRSFNGTL